MKNVPSDVSLGYGIRLPDFCLRTDLPRIVKMIRLPFKKAWMFVQKRFVWSKFKPFCRDADVIVGFLEQDSTYLAARAGKELGIRSIGWIHIDLSQHLDERGLEMSARAYADLDTVIACSNKAGQSALRLYPFLSEKMQMIYNPIDFDDLLSESVKPVPDFDFAGTNIIAVGRLEPQKGFEMLIQAHRRLLELGQEHRLIILGEGSQYSALRRLAADLGVADSVFLPGFVRNPYGWMARADVFALSSRYEGLCNVIIEALSLGTPVVSFDCPGGPSEILNNGEFGLLVPMGDVEGLAEALKTMLLDAPARERFIEKGRARAERFSTRSIMPQIERELLDLRGEGETEQWREKETTRLTM